MQVSLLCLLGKLWSRSLKLAYTLLNKLGTKNEPVLKPGDRVTASDWLFPLGSKRAGALRACCASETLTPGTGC